MASLSSWLSPDIMRALGWALIHSLWQCLAIAALAALLMAFSRRPPLRYTIAVVALGVMLAAPVTTFLLLVRPPATQTIVFQSPPVAAAPITVPPVSARVIAAIQDTPRLVPAQSLFSWLVAAWLAGVVFFSLRFAGGFLLLERKRRQSFAPDARILALCREIQSQLGVTRAIRYLECNWLQAPAVIGWLRPIVLIPVTALTGLSEAQLRAVIAHELAHIRRFDIFVNLFQIFVETLLFYHPAIWWLNKRIRAERELCCDEIALEVCGDRLDYAKALTLMAAWEAPPRLAMAANSGVLTERVFHVLGRPSSGIAQRIIGMTGSVLFLAAALACANALFVVAAPPIVQASAALSKRVSAVVASTQIAGDQLVRQALETIAPPRIKDEAKPAQSAAVELDEPVPPQTDLSGLLPAERLTTPTLLASLDARSAAATRPPPAALVRPVIRTCYNNNVRGRVVSADTIQLQGFRCYLFADRATLSSIAYGSCPNASTNPEAYDISTANRFGRYNCKFDVPMRVRLADPADARLMQPGTMMTLAGQFFRVTSGRAEHLLLTDARIVEAPRAAPVPSESATPVQISLNIEEPGVHVCRNRSVFGQVTSPKSILIQGFTCFVDDAPGGTPAIGAHDIAFGACPLASTTTSYNHKCKFDVAVNVKTADPADAAKMVPGKLVRLGGNFAVWKEGALDYVTVANAKVLFTDYYWMGGVSNLPLPMGPPAFNNGDGGGISGNGNEGRGPAQ